MTADRTCSIEGCDKPVRHRGWCGAHYQRWHKHGNPLAGRSYRVPKGEPERYFREVVLPYEGDECLIWPYGGSAGYGQFTLNGVRIGVPRLVCEKAHGPPPTPDHESAHSCGRGGDGCATKRHLRWATSAENNADRIIHGTMPRGERHPRAKLTEPEVHEIRALRGKLLQREIAELFGVNSRTVCDIQTRKNWAWLEVSAA